MGFSSVFDRVGIQGSCVKEGVAQEDHGVRMGTGTPSETLSTAIWKGHREETGEASEMPPQMGVTMLSVTAVVLPTMLSSVLNHPNPQRLLSNLRQNSKIQLFLLRLYSLAFSVFS